MLASFRTSTFSRGLLALTLEANGYRVLQAVIGQEGLVLAAHHRPALTILDLGLPDLPGQEVLRRLREWSNAPVILLSVQDDEQGKVLTHRQILREVWGAGHEEHTHYLRVYVALLREKLEADAARPEIIITEPGVGYHLLEC